MPIIPLINHENREYFFGRWVLTALLLAGLSGCATTPRTVSPAPDDIAQRAQARWDALLADDIDTAYGYLSPGYRSSVSKDDFLTELRTQRVQYVSAEYRDHECQEKTCDVRITVRYRIVNPVPGVDVWTNRAVIDEKWLLVSGQWWFLPES